MPGNPEKVFELEEARLKMLKLANSLMEDCRKKWMNRSPLIKRNFYKIKRQLEELTKNLMEFDKARQKVLEFHPVTINKKPLIQYKNDIVAISKKYLDMIDMYKKDPRSYRKLKSNHEISDIFLTEFGIMIAGTNNICTGPIDAEKLRNGEITLDELNKNHEKKAMLWYDYIKRGKTIPDKSARYIADGISSIFWMMNPIIETDKNILYQKLFFGNYDAWKRCLERAPYVAVKYVGNIRRNWTANVGEDMAGKLMDFGLSCYDDVCIPELILVSSGTELLGLDAGKYSGRPGSQEVPYRI